MGITEVHLTGGEPTAHPRLADIVRGITGIGLTTKITTIGCSRDKLQALFDSGLTSFNFSLHALDATSLLETQINRSYEWAERQLEQELEAILFAHSLGAQVKINTVLTSEHDFARVHTVFHWAQARNIPLRILSEMHRDRSSHRTVLEFMEKLAGVEIQRRNTACSSSYSAVYLLPGGNRIVYKGIRENYLEHSMCRQCTIKEDHLCKERFYGIRLERPLEDDLEQLHIRLCIHRTDPDTWLPIEDFLRSSQFAEIREKSLALFGVDKLSATQPMISQGPVRMVSAEHQNKSEGSYA
jgi:cyclic pyranopterin phosphate synthase